jgi:hypothetical protein
MQAMKSVRISNMSVYLTFLLCSCSTLLSWTLHLPNITVSLASVVFKLCCITEKTKSNSFVFNTKPCKIMRQSRDRHTLSLPTTLRWVVSFTLFPLYPREKEPPVHICTMLNRHCDRYVYCCGDDSPYPCRELHPSHPACT